MKWYEPVVGLVFAALVLTGVAVATAVSYDDGSDSHEVVEDTGH